MTSEIPASGTWPEGQKALDQYNGIAGHPKLVGNTQLRVLNSLLGNNKFQPGVELKEVGQIENRIKISMFISWMIEHYSEMNILYFAE